MSTKSRLVNHIQQHRYFYITSGVALVLLLLIALPNVYFAKVSATDYGAKIQALHEIMQGRTPIFRMNFRGEEIPTLGDHFSPIIYLFAPFVYLFGSYTLSVFQVLFLFFGGIGIYRYSLTKGNEKLISTLLTIMYFLSFGVWNSIANDAHYNVLAAGIIPWFFLAYEKNNIKGLLISLLFIIFCKENMPLMMFAIILGLIAGERFKPKKLAAFKYGLAIFSLFYFLLAYTVLMPLALDGVRNVQAEHYKLLGATPKDIIINLITHPGKALRLLIYTTPDAIQISAIKVEFYIALFVGGGFFFITRPKYLIMIAPLIAQKVLTDVTVFWGLALHYTIEFMPLIALAGADFLSGLKISYRFKRNLSFLFIGLSIATTLYNIDNRIQWQDKTRIRFYQGGHYKGEITAPEVKAEVKQYVPKGAPVSTNCNLTQYMYKREYLWSYPIVKNSEYLVLRAPTEESWPLDLEQYTRHIQELDHSTKWKKINTNSKLYIYKRQD